MELILGAPSARASLAPKEAYMHLDALRLTTPVRPMFFTTTHADPQSSNIFASNASLCFSDKIYCTKSRAMR